MLLVNACSSIHSNVAICHNIVCHQHEHELLQSLISLLHARISHHRRSRWQRWDGHGWVIDDVLVRCICLHLCMSHIDLVRLYSNSYSARMFLVCMDTTPPVRQTVMGWWLWQKSMVISLTTDPMMGPLSRPTDQLKIMQPTRSKLELHCSSKPKLHHFPEWHCPTEIDAMAYSLKVVGVHLIQFQVAQRLSLEQL